MGKVVLDYPQYPFSSVNWAKRLLEAGFFKTLSCQIAQIMQGQGYPEEYIQDILPLLKTPLAHKPDEAVPS